LHCIPFNPNSLRSKGQAINNQQPTINTQQFFPILAHPNHHMHRIKNIGSTSATFSGEKTILNAYRAYPFGMRIPDRNFSSSEYRFGFQGQESDSEIKGAGNSINYKYRMHDPRIGRFFAVLMYF
jgi:hypothetical protein